MLTMFPRIAATDAYRAELSGSHYYIFLDYQIGTVMLRFKAVGVGISPRLQIDPVSIFRLKLSSPAAIR